MAQLTEERLKEMEEEMNRFEQEILTPVDGRDSQDIVGTAPKPHVTPRASGPSSQGSSTQFLPHQVQRFQPPAPQPGMRPMFAGRGPPSMQPFPHHGMMRPPMGMGPPHSRFGGPTPRNFIPQPVFANPGASPSGNSSDSSIIAAPPTVYSAPPMKAEIRPEPDPVPLEIVHIPPVPVTKEMIIINRPKETVSFTNMEEHLKKKENKKKKMVRMAGNQIWEDNSLLDWECDDFRIFCGDLGNDVTDEILTRAFCKYPSFVKAKVVRDKRTNKTKGFGFISYKDPQDFIKAMKEMNGKYVGSRPIKLRKSCWKDRNIEVVKKKQREKEKLGLL